MSKTVDEILVIFLHAKIFPWHILFMTPLFTGKGYFGQVILQWECLGRKPIKPFFCSPLEPSASLLFFVETKLSIFSWLKPLLATKGRKLQKKKKKKNEWLRLSLQLQVLLLTKVGILAGNFSYLNLMNHLLWFGFLAFWVALYLMLEHTDSIIEIFGLPQLKGVSLI